MISFGSQARVFVATEPVDFRRGVHGLVALVAEGLKGDPYSGDVFVFRSKRADRLKFLIFDGTGMILAVDVNQGDRLHGLSCSTPPRDPLSPDDLTLIRQRRRRDHLDIPLTRSPERFSTPMAEAKIGVNSWQIRAAAMISTTTSIFRNSSRSSQSHRVLARSSQSERFRAKRSSR